jgi:hypothetical protein
MVVDGCSLPCVFPGITLYPSPVLLFNFAMLFKNLSKRLYKQILSVLYFLMLQ